MHEKSLVCVAPSKNARPSHKHSHSLYDSHHWCIPSLFTIPHQCYFPLHCSSSPVIVHHPASLLMSLSLCIIMHHAPSCPSLLIHRSSSITVHHPPLLFINPPLLWIILHHCASSPMSCPSLFIIPHHNKYIITHIVYHPPSYALANSITVPHPPIIVHHPP